MSTQLLVHRGFICSQCGMSPIVGCRWRCASCVGPSHSLCTRCVATGDSTPTHHCVCAVANVGALVEGRCTLADAGLAVGRGQSVRPSVAAGSDPVCSVCGHAITPGNAWKAVSTDITACENCLMADESAFLSDGAAPRVWLPAAARGLSTDDSTVLARLQHERHDYDCDVCGEGIVGPRWECTECGDFDACWTCVAAGQLEGHDTDHELVLCRDLVVTPARRIDPGYHGPRAVEAAAHPHTVETKPTTELEIAEGSQVNAASDDQEGVDSAAVAPLTPQEVLGSLGAVIPKELAGLGRTDSLDPGTLTKSVAEYLAEGCGEVVHPDLEADPEMPLDELLKPSTTNFQQAHPRLAAAIAIVADVLSCASRPHVTESASATERRAAAMSYWDTLAAAGVPTWAVDRSATDFLLQRACLANDELNVDDFAPTFRVKRNPSSSEAPGRPGLCKWVINEQPVYLLPFASMLCCAEAGVRPPEFHECTRADDLTTPPDALAVFVSHRWKEEAHPDVGGEDFRLAVSSIHYLCDAVVDACHLMVTICKIDLARLRATLVVSNNPFTAIQLYGHADDARPGPTVSGSLVRAALMLALRLTVLASGTPPTAEHLCEAFYFWYDYSCLPQVQATEVERALMQGTLRELSALQRQMHTLVVSTADEYLTRAWCVSELLNGGDACSLTNDYSRGKLGTLFGELAALGFVTRAIRAMINPLVWQPQEVIKILGLTITYGGDDSEAVCRTLWSCVQREFLQAEVVPLFLPSSFPKGRGDYGPRCRLDLFHRYHESLLVAVGRDTTETCASITSLRHLPHGLPYDDWLALRRAGAQTASALTRAPETVLKLCYVPDDSPGLLGQHAIDLLEIVSTLGDGLLRETGAHFLAVFLASSAEAIDLSCPMTVLIGHGNTGDALLQSAAAALLTRPSSMPARDPSVRRRFGTAAAREPVLLYMDGAVETRDREQAECDRLWPEMRCAALLSRTEADLVDLNPS